MRSDRLGAKPRTDGNGKQQCQRCQRKSIAGLPKGKGLCPYHYAEAQWGSSWADSIYESEANPQEG